jgi:hypothetical protein
MAVVPDTRYSHSKKLYMLKLNREIVIKGAECRRLCCRLWIWICSIPDPGPKQQQKEPREKINKLSYLFCIHKFHKIENY